MYNHTAIIWNSQPREHSVHQLKGLLQKKWIRLWEGQAA